MRIENLEKIKDAMICQQKYIEETEKILRFSREELERWIFNALNAELQYAVNASPFYAERYKKRMLPREISHFSDLSNIPFTTKENLRKTYPFGFLAVPQSQLIRYGESTGTSGTPTASYMTRDDWERNNILLALSLLNFFSSDDMVFIAVPYELAFAAHDVDRAFWNIGATIVSVGALNMVCPWKRAVEMMKTLHPTVLVCTPTRLLRLYDMLIDSDYDPMKICLKSLLYLGEACSFSKLEKIAKLWNINTVGTYGATETNSLSLTCHCGIQHLAENRFYFETIEPSSGTPLKEGQRGELVVTSLFSQAMPLIRYRTGDIVSLYSRPCSCGLPFRTFQHYGRCDERIVIKDKIILRFDIEETILSTEGTGCYYNVSQERDRLKILVEIQEKNAKKIEESIRDKIFKENGVDSIVKKVDKSLFFKAMDKMLKPGGASLLKSTIRD